MNRHMRRMQNRLKGRLIRSTGKEGRIDNLSPMAMLIVLMVKHMGGQYVEEDHLTDLVEQAIARTGSIENAITALESGRLILERIP
jgi:hypothetical protein